MTTSATVTATSTSSPINLQSLPIEDEKDKEIRQLKEMVKKLTEERSGVRDERERSEGSVRGRREERERREDRERSVRGRREERERSVRGRREEKERSERRITYEEYKKMREVCKTIH